MNESALTREVVKQLNLLPLCFATKVHGGPHQRKGLPDITGCFEGAFFGIEMKLPGNKPTPIQQAVLDKIEAAGGLVGVVTAPGNRDGVRDAVIQCRRVIGHEQ